MKLLLCQLNPTIGDFADNREKILKALDKARDFGVDLAIFPELTTCGYPPRDLLEDSDFIEDNLRLFRDILGASKGIGVVFGFIEVEEGRERRAHFNSAALVEDQKVLGIHRKLLLPTYDVFDEARYFLPGKASNVFDFRGHKIGLSVCEDAWNDPRFWQSYRYERDPVAEQAERGADLLINIAASPYWMGKSRLRKELLCNHAAAHRRWMIFVNQVGGNDELIFDGRSLVINPQGTLVHQVQPFVEELCYFDLEMNEGQALPQEEWDGDQIEDLFRALVLGTRDYVRKCRFQKSVLGLSGGIDSAVTAAIAVEALGMSQVVGVMMPSPFTAERSLADARDLAARLGIEYKEIAIGPLCEDYRQALAPVFAGRPADVTEENIQARIRGNLLMALSNKFGWLVLTTGNKSELATGYCTLYGDMVGGLGLLTDVPKTGVYRLAEYVNRRREVIPKSILTREPTAELRPGQKDSDSLPPYDILDPILIDYIEEGLSYQELLQKGYDPATVQRVLKLIDHNEYKRRQASMGLKVRSKAFGIGRRMPIARGPRQFGR